MDVPRSAWRNTTHDWTSTVDPEHLAHIRQNPAAFAPGGVQHLILEVVAYAADEAECSGGGHCRITLHPDGSVAVTDDGRGTDTRFDEHGEIVKKPIMATKDLRFFDPPDAPLLPDDTTDGVCPPSPHSAHGSSIPTAAGTDPGPSGTNTVCPPPACNRSPTTTRPGPLSISSRTSHCVWQAAQRPMNWHGSQRHGHTSPSKSTTTAPPELKKSPLGATIYPATGNDLHSSPEPPDQAHSRTALRDVDPRPGELLDGRRAGLGGVQSRTPLSLLQLLLKTRTGSQDVEGLQQGDQVCAA